MSKPLYKIGLGLPIICLKNWAVIPLNRIVKKRLSQNPLLIVSVKAHPKTAYSDYVRVIDQLKIANAKKISIANSN